MTELPLCSFLRTKNAYGEVETPSGDWQAFADASDCYWCLSTMLSIGPDGGLAAVDRCGRGRSCHRSSEDVELIASK